MKFKCNLSTTAVALILGVSSLSAMADQKSITNISTNQLDWKVTDEKVAFASLEGDRFKESYMAMIRLPAGLISPAHTKTANMFGIVVSGTIRHIAVGADPSTEVLLPPGSIYKIPAGLPHISKCNAGVDCVTFLYQDGKFDFLPVSK